MRSSLGDETEIVVEMRTGFRPKDRAKEGDEYKTKVGGEPRGQDLR